MNVLNNNVLVLNSVWMPIDVICVYDAVRKVCRDVPRAKFVDPETYASYDFDSWVDTWEDAVRASKFESEKVLESSCFAFRLPEIIVLREYDGDGQGYKKIKGPPKFSRKNIYLRDSYTCQYCGKKHSSEDLNLDHVTPKSRGGKMSWRNIVVACIPCNDRKKNKTPEEAGMRLIRIPNVPKPHELRRPWGDRLRSKLKGQVLPSWEYFLGKIYWNIELHD